MPYRPWILVFVCLSLADACLRLDLAPRCHVLSPPRFVGLETTGIFAGDPLFWKCWAHRLLPFFSVPLCMSRRWRWPPPQPAVLGLPVFLTIFYMPSVYGVATAVVWLAL